MTIRPYHAQYWHDNFTKDREMPLIQFCQTKIDPAEPVAINGFNAYVVIKRLADQADQTETHLQILWEQLDRLGLLDQLMEDGKREYSVFNGQAVWMDKLTQQIKDIADSRNMFGSEGVSNKDA